MEKSHGRGDPRSYSCPKLAIANMVSDVDKNSKTNPLVQKEKGQPFSQGETIDNGRLNEYPSGSMPLLDQNIGDQGFKKSEIRFLRKAWRNSTKKTYSNYLKQWVQFCKHFEFNPRQPKPNRVAKFLILLSKHGSSHSMVYMARCALSAGTHVDDNMGLA